MHGSAPGQGSMDVVHRHGRGRSIAQGGVGPHTIGVIAPRSDYDLSLLETVEDLAFQALIPQFPVEALAIAVLPRATILTAS